MDETRQKERERYDSRWKENRGKVELVEGGRWIVGGTLVLSSRSGFPPRVGLTCAFEEANTCAHQTRNTNANANTNTNKIRYTNTITNTNAIRNTGIN